MAMRSASSMPLLILCPSISIAASTEAGNDEAALLTFKAAAVGGGGGLAPWMLNVSGSSGARLFCGWEGVTCRGRRVVALSPPSSGLAGVLSPVISNFSYLRALNLSWNMLRASIPASLVRLHHLRVLDLSHNVFSSELPANLSSRLTVMELQNNQLRGHVPSELRDRLTHLRVLDLVENDHVT